MQKIKSIFFTLCCAICTCNSMAQNPITNAKGVSDPHIRVFNDTIYLYSGHDSNPTDKIWDMKDWRVFSTTNLLDWTLEETISPNDNYMAKGTKDCWASDAATRNGQYYFYFSDRKRGIGVMSSDKPTGPFKDALGKPLVSPLHDPTIFVDNDENKTPYLVYGDKSDAYYIAELNENMISTAETPKAITITGEGWANAPAWMDKNYLFKEKDTYYLSWGQHYATSKNIYGPYKSAGVFGTGHHLDEFAHGSFFWWKGQFYHVWCYYIKNGFKFRETIMSYCHVADDGTIVTDTAFLDAHFKNGVGQYNASWDKIEAEWFYEKSLEIAKTGTKMNGFVLSNIKNDSWVKFANVNFETSPLKIEIQLKNTEGEGKIEIRENSISGRILAEVSVKINKGNQSTTLLASMKKVIGKKDIYLKFTGNKTFKTELDYFKFID
ncbi:family 43 glycosylhydrolase [Algibacter miyuki]|uniref:Family 43 glycosylhydrolase n=1 Tax=Algibacter miyuki TaxID=1306933 RepID=A0ABV5H4F6_9FLAO|nr:family 43 glycosylhydrolase [Algibacter miyuki]MDN3663826.1 family 43 glycosylhydrolase [Algibacter miyuki]